MSDADVVEHLQRFPWTPWLAFDEAEFKATFRGLDVAASQQAVERRLDLWSPSVASRSGRRLYELAVDAVRATAVLHANVTDAFADATRDHFVAWLAVLDGLTGTALEMHTARELGTILLERRAYFAAELEGLDPNHGWHRETESALSELSAVAVAFGAEAFAGGGRPRVRPERLWWIDAADDELLAVLSDDGQLAASWGGGIVAVQVASRIGGLRAIPRRVEVIARRASVFTTTFLQSTSAQLERDWGPRRDAIVADKSVQLPPLCDHLCELALEQWVVVRRTRAMFEAEHPDVGARLARVEEHDTRRLLSELARTRSVAQAQADLIACEARLLTDLELFTELGSMPSWKGMRAAYVRLARQIPRWKPRTLVPGGA